MPLASFGVWAFVVAVLLTANWRVIQIPVDMNQVNDGA